MPFLFGRRSTCIARRSGNVCLHCVANSSAERNNGGMSESAVSDLIAAIRASFSQAIRPDRFAVASAASGDWTDDEVDRAEAVFSSRTPETLQSTDVGTGAGWPEAFLTPSALHYYMPGFARLLLDARDDIGFGVDDFVSILPPDSIATLNPQQKAAIADLLNFIRNRLDDRGKQIVDRRLKRLRSARR